MDFPMSGFGVSPILLLILGFCAGITSGFYGIGGGWIVTPVLNILGLPMPYAIGTSLIYIIVASTFGSIKHRKLKNVNYISGAIIGVFAILGVLGGSELILYLEELGNVDTIVRIVYMVFLSAVGGYMMLEKKIKFNFKIKRNKHLTKRFFDIKISGDKYVSFVLLIFIGFLIGILNSTMGIGGGFVLLPILIYILKFPVTLAVGTSLFAIMITSISGGVAYIMASRVDWISVIYMAITAIIGTSIGASATKKVEPDKIKFLFAITVLCGGIAVLLKQLQFTFLSSVLIFTVGIIISIIIIFSSYIYREKIV